MTATEERKTAIISEGALTFTDEYSEITGGINIRELYFAGDVKITGDVNADSIAVEGNIEVDGNLSAKRVKAEGEVSVSQSATVSNLSASNVCVNENLSSNEEIKTRMLLVGGVLNAAIVSLEDKSYEKLEDVFVVEGDIHIEEGLYFNDAEVSLQ